MTEHAEQDVEHLTEEMITGIRFGTAPENLSGWAEQHLGDCPLCGGKYLALGKALELYAADSGLFAGSLASEMREADTKAEDRSDNSTEDENCRDDGTIEKDDANGRKRTHLSGTNINRNEQTGELTIYESRVGHWRLEKRGIGALVAASLHNLKGQSVAIDGGSTNMAIARALCLDAAKGNRSVGIIMTNHTEIFEMFSKAQNGPELYVTGGALRRDRKTLIGPETVQAIKNYRFAVSIVGVNCFNYPFVMTGSGMENDVKIELIRSSARYVVFPFDSSKWGAAAGRLLSNIPDLVVQEKKVVCLVTSYPHEGSQLEPDDHATRLRCRQNLQHGIRSLYTEWPHDLCVNLVAFDFSSGPEEIPRVLGQEKFAEKSCVVDIEEVYRKWNPEKKTEISLVMSVELSHPSQIRLPDFDPNKMVVGSVHSSTTQVAVDQRVQV